MASWPRRECSVNVRFRARTGASSVRLAGDFTGWESGALPMSDPEGDGVWTLRVGPEHGLVAGRVHAYKVIVDGEWMLDPDAAYRKYDGSCLNSGMLAPSCELGPEIRVGALTPSWEAGVGSASVRATIATALDGSAPAEVRFTLDDAPLPAGSAVLDMAAGAYDVSLSGLSEGRHVLAIRVTDMAGREAAPVDLPFWIEETPFEWRDALMYMIVVDRFANGDRAIDAPVGGPVEYPADFHGGDLDGILAVMRAGYFEELGVDVLWLSPINDQAEGHFAGRDDTRRYAGYHGYWPERGREVDPRFGGNDSLRALIDEAHSRGIRVLLDLINNQVHEQHEYYRDHPEWFRTGCVCGIDAGCGWSERPLDCLFASYLPDIDWRVPGAEAQFIADALYWIDEYDVDGFRIDAVKHVETSSIFNLRAALQRRFEAGGYRHYLVGETAVTQGDSADYGCGEVYTSGYQWLDAYVGPGGLDGQFDFPSHHRLGGLVEGSMGFDDVERVVADGRAMLDPEGLHVEFLGTHDSTRIASRASFDPSQGCRWPDGGGCSVMPSAPTDPAAFARLRRAMTVLYGLPGMPFLYYGDELAMPGGNDPDNRRDMVFDGALAPVAMGSGAMSGLQSAHRDFMRALGQARADSVAWRRGRRITLLATSDLHVVARVGDTPGELVVLVANRGAAISDLRVDGLTTAILGGATSFTRAAGSGALRISGASLRLDLGAGEAAAFVAAP